MRNRDESGPNYITATAMAVLHRFGFPTNQPSLGIPTVCFIQKEERMRREREMEMDVTSFMIEETK